MLLIKQHRELMLQNPIEKDLKHSVKTIAKYTYYVFVYCKKSAGIKKPDTKKKVKIPQKNLIQKIIKNIGYVRNL